MRPTLTVIDSFKVPTRTNVELPHGFWFVLDGTHESLENLPSPGSVVDVSTPTGQALAAKVLHVRLNPIGVAAIMFEAMEADGIPRLSKITRPDTRR